MQLQDKGNGNAGGGVGFGLVWWLHRHMSLHG